MRSSNARSTSTSLIRRMVVDAEPIPSIIVTGVVPAPGSPSRKTCAIGKYRAARASSASLRTRRGMQESGLATHPRGELRVIEVHVGHGGLHQGRFSSSVTGAASAHAPPQQRRAQAQVVDRRPSTPVRCSLRSFDVREQLPSAPSRPGATLGETRGAVPEHQDHVDPMLNRPSSAPLATPCRTGLMWVTRPPRDRGACSPPRTRLDAADEQRADPQHASGRAPCRTRRHRSLRAKTRGCACVAAFTL